MNYRCIDLFSGAGGLSAGFHNSGYKLLAAIEKESVFCKTHHYNFPESKTINADICNLSPIKFSEITDIKKGQVDLIIGSPPCQTFSSIGVPKIRSVRNGEIETDPRNYLFKYFFEYVSFYQPDIFLMENVPTMKTRYKGKLFDRVLDYINSLGYEPHIAVLNSVHYGVPQIRKRLIVVGTRNGLKFAFPPSTYRVSDDEQPPCLFGNGEVEPLRPATTVFDAISDLPIIYDGCREDELPYSRKSDLTDYQRFIRNSCGTVRNNICRVSNDRAKEVFAYMKQGSKYMDLPPDIRQILPFREDIFRDRLKRLDLSKPSWTVLAHIGMDGYMFIHPTENRTLSVREAARIQSFSDSFVFVGNMREQYIQVGNAVPPMMAKALASQIKVLLG